MNPLILVLALVFIVQIILFVWGRKIRKKEKEENVLLKYDIKTRQRAWQLLADPSIPEKDKEQIKEIYDKEVKD